MPGAMLDAGVIEVKKKTGPVSPSGASSLAGKTVYIQKRVILSLLVSGQSAQGKYIATWPSLMVRKVSLQN